MESRRAGAGESLLQEEIVPTLRRLRLGQARRADHDPAGSAMAKLRSADLNGNPCRGRGGYRSKTPTARCWAGQAPHSCERGCGPSSAEFEEDPKNEDNKITPSPARRFPDLAYDRKASADERLDISGVRVPFSFDNRRRLSGTAVAIRKMTAEDLKIKAFAYFGRYNDR